MLSAIEKTFSTSLMIFIDYHPAVPSIFFNGSSFLSVSPLSAHVFYLERIC